MHSTVKLQSNRIIVTSCSFPEQFSLSNAQCTGQKTSKQSITSNAASSVNIGCTTDRYLVISGSHAVPRILCHVRDVQRRVGNWQHKSRPVVGRKAFPKAPSGLCSLCFLLLLLCLTYRLHTAAVSTSAEAREYMHVAYAVDAEAMQLFACVV